MDIVVDNPIFAASTAYALYVPRSQIVVPSGGTPPAVSYYLQEDGIGRFLTEDNANLLILET